MSQITQFLDSLPLLVFFSLIVAILMAGVELGFPLGRWIRREEGLDKHPMESSATNTVALSTTTSATLNADCDLEIFYVDPCPDNK